MEKKSSQLFVTRVSKTTACKAMAGHFTTRGWAVRKSPTTLSSRSTLRRPFSRRKGKTGGRSKSPAPRNQTRSRRRSSSTSPWKRRMMQTGPRLWCVRAKARVERALRQAARERSPVSESLSFGLSEMPRTKRFTTPP